MDRKQVILGIESSCDDTAAAVIVDGVLKSNVIAGQEVHAKWGGVVPELASRAHQENIVPVVAEAIVQAGVARQDISAVAYTNGPGLIGALLVGSCFGRSFAMSLQIPSIAVDHMQAHIMAHFIDDGSNRPQPPFPFLNLTVSGGHTLIVQVNASDDMVVLGATVDDAAGEAFDKAAKVLGLPYPGGPQIAKLAELGTPGIIDLPFPSVPGLNMSFSGLKTAFQEKVRYHYADKERLQEALPDLCATVQEGILKILLSKLRKAMRETGISNIGLAGGVSANKALRAKAADLAESMGGKAFCPPFSYCTDNAAMIAQAGLFLHKAGKTSPLNTVPYTKMS